MAIKSQLIFHLLMFDESVYVLLMG